MLTQELHKQSILLASKSSLQLQTTAVSNVITVKKGLFEARQTQLKKKELELQAEIKRLEQEVQLRNQEVIDHKSQISKYSELQKKKEAERPKEPRNEQKVEQPQQKMGIQTKGETIQESKKKPGNRQQAEDEFIAFTMEDEQISKD